MGRHGDLFIVQYMIRTRYVSFEETYMKYIMYLEIRGKQNLVSLIIDPFGDGVRSTVSGA